MTEIATALSKPSERASSLDGIFKLAMWPLLVSIFVSKFSFPSISDSGLDLSIFVIFAVSIIFALAGRFELNTNRTAIYLVTMGWIGGGQLFNGSESSLSSLLLLAVFYFPFLLQIRLQKECRLACPDRTIADAFSMLCTLFAAIGILQFLAQGIIGIKFAFPLEHFLPRGYLIGGFNHMNALEYGSKTFKSNGVFFLEPSFFSQFLALGLLLEASTFLRLGRLTVLVVGLALTFSGTGLIVLGVGFSVLAFQRNRQWVLVVGSLVGLIAVLFSSELGLKPLISRTDEFSRIGSSGFERFVSWIYFLSDYFWGNATRVWLGSGTGSYRSATEVARYMSAQMALPKAIFEFGIPGAFLFFSFLFYCVCSSKVAAAVRAGLIACIFMNGPYSGLIAGMILTLALWPSRISSNGQKLSQRVG